MGPENFAQIRPTVQKLRHFFEVTDGHTDARTHGRTDIYESPLYHYRKFLIFFFFCIYVRGKEGNSTTPTKFIPLHFVKLAALASLVKDQKDPKFTPRPGHLFLLFLGGGYFITSQKIQTRYSWVVCTMPPQPFTDTYILNLAQCQWMSVKR